MKDSLKNMAGRFSNKKNKTATAIDYKQEAHYWKQKYDALLQAHSPETTDVSVLQTICEMSLNPIFLIEVVEDKDYILRFANQKALETEKKPAADIIDREINSTFPLIKEKGLFDAMQKVYRTGIPIEFPFVVRDDKTIYEWKNTYILKLSGQYISFIYRDETDKRKKELALKEN